MTFLDTESPDKRCEPAPIEEPAQQVAFDTTPELGIAFEKRKEVRAVRFLFAIPSPEVRHNSLGNYEMSGPPDYQPVMQSRNFAPQTRDVKLPVGRQQISKVVAGRDVDVFTGRASVRDDNIADQHGNFIEV